MQFIEKEVPDPSRLMQGSGSDRMDLGKFEKLVSEPELTPVPFHGPRSNVGDSMTTLFADR